MRIKKTKEYCLAHHLCVKCHKRHTFKYRLCKTCREYNAEYNRERTKLFRKLGLCIRCGGNKEINQYALCEVCREKNKKYMYARRHDYAVA